MTPVVSALAQLQGSGCDSQKAGGKERPEGRVLARPSEGLPLFRPPAMSCAQDPDFPHHLGLRDPGCALSFSFLFPRADGAGCGRCHTMK